MLLSGHEIDEEGRADKGRQDADGDLHRQQIAGHVVHQQQKDRAQQHGRRKKTAAVAAHQLAAEMGDHKAHPADHAADGDAGGGQHRGAQDHHQPQRCGVDAHGAGLLLAEGQQIDAPAQQQKRHRTQRHRQQGEGHVLHPRAAETAHEPIGDGGQLVGGVGHQLDIGGSGGEQGRDHDARQQQVHHLIAPDAPGQHVHQRHRGKAGGKGRRRDAQSLEAQQDRQRRAEAGA